MSEMSDRSSRLVGARSSAARRWRRRLADERAEARVYRDLAARRWGEEREILLGLAEAEERHAAHWERLLGDDAGPTTAWSSGSRSCSPAPPSGCSRAAHQSAAPYAS